MVKKKGKQPIPAAFMALAALCACVLALSCPRGDERASGKRLSLISGSENADLIPLMEEFGKQSGIKVDVTLRGTLDIVVELNRAPSSYDAVWASNSIWLSMLENKGLVKNAKSTSISPVVFGIRASKAKELGLDGPAVRTADILAAVAMKKLSFLMGSATRTNSGASAYLGLLSVLAGSPEVLTKADIDNAALKSKLREFFAGIERASGSAEFLDELFLSGSYDALVSYESSLLRLNRRLEAAGKETLRLVYPLDGVSLSDSPLGYVDNGFPAKDAAFKAFQAWALSAATQRKLTATGRRAWYGGDVENPAPELFKAEWGVDTKRYIVPSKYPQADVVRAALTLYQSELKKPSFTAFCLDFSGSMYGDGRDQLMTALDYILDPEKSGKDFIQFSERDSLSLYPFSTDVGAPIESGGADARAAYESVFSIVPDGSTNLHGAAETALRRLALVDGTRYVRSVVIMTDGKANVGRYADLEKAYEEIGMDIPIFCITFGGADLKELKKIAKLSNARVFDGRTDLVAAFKEVRGYN